MLQAIPKLYLAICRSGTICSIQSMDMRTYFFQVLLAIALATFSFPAYSESCSSSFETFAALHKNLADYVRSGEPTNAGVLRRSNSVRRSLVAVRVYCSQNAKVLILANEVEELLDEIDQTARGG